jgi:amidase
MPVYYDSLLAVSDKIRTKQLSATTVTTSLLDRIRRYDGRFNSAILVLEEAALEQAQQADMDIAAGHWRGPLHGVPVGIKDLLWTKGLPTTAGMELLRDFRPREDATVVARLKQAGAVIIAKLNMTEAATLHHHPAFPRPLNPWSAAHWTGISSSGSGVAPAAGFCFGAIGSDTGGSIRMPCAANNLSGIKPTWGRVSRHGLVHNSESLDHLGPMARSAADAAAILQAIAGHDAHDPTSLLDPVPDYLALMDEGVEGMTLGIDWNFATDGMAHEIAQAFENAVKVFEQRGMRIREVQFPWTSEDLAAVGPLLHSELVLSHTELYPAQAERYSPLLREILEHSLTIKGIDVANAHIRRDRFKGRLRSMFSDVALLLVPALGLPVPTWDTMDAIARGESKLDMDLLRFTVPFNVAGVPTLSLPGGFNQQGLPVGIQLAGPWLAEAALIRAGVAFQKATDFHTRHPNLEAT